MGGTAYAHRNRADVAGDTSDNRTRGAEVEMMSAPATAISTIRRCALTETPTTADRRYAATTLEPGADRSQHDVWP
ncbi:hypothetical protein GCM10009733_037410 [Nonomuraea maheshkhaliensis]|uniref:Uncharacterized protein n=1 Tax=Nonomuraea maheshkhaliensis TaxID=419590 RepID=A0ABP4R6R2_9ACTN